MKQSTQISALIITKNEEKNISSLLDNLSFADEIIIVDSFSTDNTEKIAIENDKVRFYKHHFENFSSQRNIALQYATYPWILFIDADERISDKLKDEIFKVIKNPKADSYYFLRNYYYEGKPMYYTGLQSDKNIRLFKNGIGKYRGLVHEKLNTTGKTATLKNKLTHYSFTDYKTYKNKLSHYGKLKGKEKFENGAKYSFTKQVLHSSYNFFNRYFFRLGFLDGKKGLIVSYLISYSVWERYNEIKLLQQKKK